MALPVNDYLFLNLVENYFATMQMTGLLEQLQANWLIMVIGCCK